MSTLQIVGTVVGAVIGTIIAPGAGTIQGALIGGAIGSVVNSIINPPHIEGARLGDLTVVSSATGAVRPVGYGKIRVAGNIIWAIPIIEHKKTSKQGGKGGPVNTTYDYGATFALALCEGPADSVMRIWADSKLVYDASSGTDNIQKTGFNFRFYAGNGTQTADSIIEAHAGVGNVPGYRGTCYLVFDDIPLADYGNRIPNITAEVVFSTEPAFDFERLVRADPSIFATVGAEGLAVNPLSHVGYVWGKTPTGLIEFDVDTMTTIREKALTDVLAPLSSGDTGGTDPAFYANQIVGWDEALYFVTGDTTNGPHIVRVDPNTLLATAEFSASRDLSSFSTSNFWFADKLCSITHLDDVGGVINHILVSTVFNNIGMLTVPDLTYVWGVGQTIAGGKCHALGQGRIAVGQGEAWQLNYDTDILYIVKISLVGGVDPVATTEATYSPTDFDATAVHMPITYGFPGNLVYDEGDDSLLFQVDLADATPTNFSVLAKWSPTSGLIFINRVDALTGAGLSSSSPSRISGGTYARLTTNNDVVSTDSATGDIISTEVWPLELGVGYNNQAYESGDRIIIAWTLEGGLNAAWTKLRLGRFTSAGTTLGAIVLDQCERAGFDAADINVSALTDTVQGFVISQRSLVGDILKPLMQVYLVDGVESDYVLKFTHRGGATVADLAQDDLLRISDANEPFTETRQQEIELPMRVTLTYTDSDKDYQNNTQMAKRARQPNPTVFTDNQTDLQLAIVTTATPAKQMAEKILTSVWNERKTFAVRLAPKYGYLDAGDAVTLTLDDGYVIRGRMLKADVGVDHSIDTVIALETDGQYVSVAEADDGVPWSGSSAINNPLPSKLILLDTPLLRDVDDLGGTAIRGYWAGGSYRTDGAWPGAALQSSPDVSTWTTIDATPDEMTWGAIETAPADPASFWRTQFDGTMTIRVSGGTFIPTSTNDLGLANLENPMAIIKADGQVEVVQYRDVTVLGDGRYTLAVFYRGVRGTDAMGGGIAAGDLFVFLGTTGISEIAVPIADHNVVEFYRPVTSGSIAAAGMIQGFTYHGRDLMPYAPVDGAAALSGSPQDIVLTWVRRTRMAGELRDGIDTVPLNETTEAYEIDILDAPGGTVLRTLNATTPTVTYPHAQIVTDFGSPPTELLVDIYQMSEVVGRGFATEQLLEVA